MQNSLLMIHGTVSFVMAIVVSLAIIRLSVGLIRRQAYDRLARWMMWAFSGTNVLEWLVGLAVLITMGNYGSFAFWSHAATMTAAVVISFLPYRWRHLEDRTRYLRTLRVVIGVLGLALLGVMFLAFGGKKQG